jgi:hypothetical protein
MLQQTHLGFAQACQFHITVAATVKERQMINVYMGQPAFVNNSQRAVPAAFGW